MITVLIPTKGRPESLVRCVRSIPPQYGFVIVATCGEDVPSEVIEMPHVYKRIMYSPTWTIIEAQINAAKAAIGHIIPAADDVEFLPGCIESAEKVLNKNVVGLNVVNMPHSRYGFMLIDREYITQNDFFCPDYKHFFADTEFGGNAERDGRFIFCKEARMNHYHPSATGKADKTHSEGRNEKLSHDEQVYCRRVLHAKL